MFWYIVGFFAFIVSLLSLWVNASAFGMEEDGTPQSEYEKMLGLGAKLKDKRQPQKSAKRRAFILTIKPYRLDNLAELG